MNKAKTSANLTAPPFPNIGQPALRALQNAGLHSLQQLTERSEAELLQLHGFGPKALRILREALAEKGWAFRAPTTAGNPATHQPPRALVAQMLATDRAAQNAAYQALLQQTEAPVAWAYEVWDELRAGLTHPDNHVRAIAAQVLANLAKSDPKGRMLKDFAALLAVTKDERFVTARHSLQAIWKVGVGGRKHQQLVVQGLEKRFHECATEKNGTLRRYDIIQGLRHLYEAVRDDGIRATALALIETETDLKYRRKYATVWKKA